MLDLRHGGNVPAPDAPGAAQLALRLGVNIVRTPPATTPFDYLLPQLNTRPDSHIPGDNARVTADLKRLGEALTDTDAAVQTDPAVEVNSTTPAVYTYWGQFIDHDMTANTDTNGGVSDITTSPVVPVAPDVVARNLRNLRRPTFDLDSVYGKGPGLDGLLDLFPDPGPSDRGFYDGIRMRLGDNAVGNQADGTPIPGVQIPPDGDFKRDLPRIGPLLRQGVITELDIPESLRNDVTRDTRAFIADLRNDENLIVAQFHVAFLRFHNKVVEAIEADPRRFGVFPGTTSGFNQVERFTTARRLVRFHYQWLVVHDYLKTVTLPGIVDKLLVGGPKHYRPLGGIPGAIPGSTLGGTLFAPLEYSVAAFRFGHTMVRGGYDHNRNFAMTFDELFQYVGNGHVRNGDGTTSTPSPFERKTATLPFSRVIEWNRMTNKADPNETHFARKVDTRLVPSLHNMPNEGNTAPLQGDPSRPIRILMRSLAQRNLLRGYLLSIPTGQAVAREMRVPVLSEAELQQGNTAAVNAALRDGGFLQNTPLWYYVLKEAEVRANGNSLGELGSRIVAETMIGIMRNDPDSYLNALGGWDPSKGVMLPNGDPIVTIRDFFAFAGLTA